MARYHAAHAKGSFVRGRARTLPGGRGRGDVLSRVADRPRRSHEHGEGAPRLRLPPWLRNVHDVDDARHRRRKVGRSSQVYRFALGIDRPLYLSVHSAYATLGPQGTAVIHVAKYLGSSAGDARANERELEALMDLIQPGWRELVVRGSP